jgi:hypothetical protein
MLRAFLLAGFALMLLAWPLRAQQSAPGPAPDPVVPPEPTIRVEEPQPLPPVEPQPPGEPPARPHSFLNELFGFTGPTGNLSTVLGVDGSGFPGQGGFGLGGPGRMPTVPIASYQATWYPSQSVVGQPTHLGFERQNLTFSAPLWTDGVNFIAGHVRVGIELFQTDAVLPVTLTPIPKELWDISLGLSGGHRFENGWVVGGGINVGSASDKPFASIDTMNIGFNTFLRIPAGDRDSWLLSLSYSPLGQVSFPLPGIAYLWVPSDYLTMNLGLPFMIVYRPTESWIIEASYMLLTNVHAKVSYLLTDSIRLYAGYDYSYESHYISVNSVLPDSSGGFERFFYYEQRLTGGIHFAFTPTCGLDLMGGYAFNREFQLGKSLNGATPDKIDVEAGAFLTAQFRIRF